MLQYYFLKKIEWEVMMFWLDRLTKEEWSYLKQQQSKVISLMLSAGGLVLLALLILLIMYTHGVVDYHLLKSWQTLLKESEQSPYLVNLMVLSAVSLYFLVYQVIFIHLLFWKRSVLLRAIRVIRLKLRRLA